MSESNTSVEMLEPVEDRRRRRAAAASGQRPDQAFPGRGGLFAAKRTVRAVDNVSFAVAKGETVGIVGKSGCGKSTTARLLMHLMPRDAGDIIYDGMTVGQSLSLARAAPRHADGVPGLLRLAQSAADDRGIDRVRPEGPRHGRWRGAGAGARAARQGRPRPAHFADRYPHEISGGQRQRVNIARALALSPRLVILDEAVSALDKSVEAQVLNLLLDLKHEFGLTYVFISHDLNVVRFISDRVLVMYLGEVVELGPVDEVWDAPAIPIRARCLPRCRRRSRPSHREAADRGRSAQPDRSALRLPLPHPLSVRRAALRKCDTKAHRAR